MRRRGFAPEFRRRALELLDAGHSVHQVPQDPGVSDQSIYTWRKQRRVDVDLDEHETTIDKEELSAARRKIRALEANGIDSPLARRISDGINTGDVKALAEAVDNAIVDRLTICGSHGECVDRLLEAYRRGINEPQILLSGDDSTSLFKVMSDARGALA